MNPNKYCLLIGNSRWHWAKKSLGNWEFFHTSSNVEEISLLKREIWKWAAVGSIPHELELITNKQIKLKDIPIKKAPQWLGVDRALASWGAFQKAKSQGLHSKGIMVADAGTVFSITCISSNGEFKGGQLMAGLNLQRLAMVEKTELLKLPKNNFIPEKIFPFSTEEAILRGTFESLVCTLIQAQKNSGMPIFLCGGDADILYASLEKKIDIIYSPNIILETIININ